MRSVPKAVFILGLVSFFTDCSSEMIYPLLPIFLSSQLGANALTLGFIEGVAETTAAILKLFAGVWTDRILRRKPFILAGYSLSGLVRPLVGLAQSWGLVFGIRFADRVGKGIRSSPRDALITEATPIEARGLAFGFHRAMDHAGAVLGPLLAASILLIPGIGLRQVFLWAAIPGVLAILAIIFFLRENPGQEPRKERSPFLNWNLLNLDFKLALLSLLFFALGNSTDAFLLLRLSESEIRPEWIAVLWSAHHVIKMLASYFGGIGADRFGDRRMMILGWLLYAGIYFGFAMTLSKGPMVILFLVYGICFGLSEPAEKSFVSKIADSQSRGTAFGFYHLTTGIAALPASLLFGGLWQRWGAAVAFEVGAALALGACIILSFVGSSSSASPSTSSRPN